MMSLVAAATLNPLDEAGHITRGANPSDMVLPTYRRDSTRNLHSSLYHRSLPPELHVFQPLLPTISAARQHLFMIKATTSRSTEVTLNGDARALDELLAMYMTKLSEDIGIRSKRTGEQIILQEYMHDMSISAAAEHAAKTAKDIEARFAALVLEAVKGLSEAGGKGRNGWLGRSKRIKYRELAMRSKVILDEAMQLRRGLEAMMVRAVALEREQLPRYEA